MWSFSAATISASDRASGFLVGWTLSWVHGFRFAFAASKSPLPGPGTEYFSYSSVA